MRMRMAMHHELLVSRLVSDIHSTPEAHSSPSFLRIKSCMERDTFESRDWVVSTREPRSSSILLRLSAGDQGRTSSHAVLVHFLPDQARLGREIRQRARNDAERVVLSAHEQLMQVSLPSHSITHLLLLVLPALCLGEVVRRGLRLNVIAVPLCPLLLPCFEQNLFDF